jgi:hypothetical protein
MELARTLNILWRRRRLVGLAALLAAFAALLSVYDVGIFPPSLSSRTNVFATASTQLLVDTPQSSFANTANDLTPLETRASVFARVLASPAAITLIAREAKLPANSIEAQGPFDVNLPTIQAEPTAGKRSTEIIGEGALYRLRFDNNPILPIVSVFAQAPTSDKAIALANAVPRALGAYVKAIQAHEHTPEEERVVIRELGSATGGIVNSSANVQIAALVFIVVFGILCMLVVPAHTIARGWRDAGVFSDAELRPATSSSNGRHERPPSFSGDPGREPTRR